MGCDLLLVLSLVFAAVHVGRALRCACTENSKKCTSIHETPADFQHAQSTCRDLGGEIMQAGSSLSNETIASLLNNASGLFWTGLKPNASCSACPQKCLAVSNGTKWTERECERTVDGFICDRVRWDSVCFANMTQNATILSNDTCMHGHCEHECAKVPGGYMCYCKKDFKPSRKDPRMCEPFCLSAICKKVCLVDEDYCNCPPGYITDEDICTDIDECISNHNCAHQCINTFGSYACSCMEDHILVNGFECIPKMISTTTPHGLFLTPSLNYTRGALASPGEYVGVVVFILAALMGLVMLVRYFTKSKTDVGLKECDELEEAQQRL